MITKQNSILLKIIAIIIIIVVCFIIMNFFHDNSNNNSSTTIGNVTNVDYANTIPSELTETPTIKTRNILEQSGYSFVSSTAPDGQINYTSFTNGTITVTALIEIEKKSYLVEFLDKSIGQNACGVTDTSINTDEEKSKQYEAYLKWKDNIGLTEEQIKQVLIVTYLDRN